MYINVYIFNLNNSNVINSRPRSSVKYSYNRY